MDPLADVAAMRRTAAVLDQRADELSAVAARIDGQVGGMVYAGPAADEFRAEVADRHRTLLRSAAELRGLADLLLRTAAATAATPGSGVLG